MNKLLSAAILALVLASCSQDRSEQRLEMVEYSEEFNLVPIRDVSFEIDSTTSNSIRSIKYLDYNSQQQIYLLNELTNSIEVFDLNKETWSSRIKLAVEGPNGVGVASYVLPVTEDSILIFSKSQELSIVNSAGQLIKKYDPCYDRSTGEGAFLLALAEITPIKVGQSVFFVATNAYDPFEETARNNNMGREMNIAELNLLENNCAYHYSYPENYSDADGLWSTQYYDVKYHDYNPDLDKFVISLPADENVYLTDYNDGARAFYAGSKYFGIIWPFYNKRTLNSISREEMTKDYALNPSYQNVRYDPYRKLYYRVAELPYSEEEYEVTPQAFSGIKRWSLIILDENLEKKGEVLMPELDYLAGSFLITKEGLLIYNYVKNQNDENHLNYTLYGIE